MRGVLEAVKLTDHFSAWEFRCGGETCCCHGAVLVDAYLVHVLEELRQLVGGPIKVTSGFRCDEWNASESVGGHPRSFHRIGWAADVTSFVLRQDLEGWAHKASEMARARVGDGKTNVIWYPKRNFIHVDVGHRIGSDPVRVSDSVAKKRGW